MFANSPRRLARPLSLLVVFSLLLGSAAPAANAQQGGQIFLPLVNTGPATHRSGLIFRTLVHPRTHAQWRDLERLGVIMLDRGGDWALVLVDGQQLESLARRRFNPESTNTLQTLVAAAGDQAAV